MWKYFCPIGRHLCDGDIKYPAYSNVKNKTSVFSYIKVTLLLTILYIILSLETVKNLITKLTNNHIFTYITTSVIFIMVTFCSIKFML